MSIKDIMEIATAIIACVGGSGVIIIGLSKWFGGVLANKLLENEKAEHSKELESYKNKLNEQLNRIKAISDKELHITKAQYDNEYKIYMEIWAKLHNCVIFTLQLYPQGLVNVPIDETAFFEYQKEKYKIFVENYNDFSLAIDKYAPFYKKEFYEKFIELRNLCSRQGSHFNHYEIQRKVNLSYTANRDVHIPIEVEKDIWTNIPNAINKLEENLIEEIREYLLNLRLKG